MMGMVITLPRTRNTRKIRLVLSAVTVTPRGCPTIELENRMESRYPGKRTSGPTQMKKTATPNSTLDSHREGRAGSKPRENTTRSARILRKRTG